MTKLGDYRKPLEEQAKDLGYDSIEDALKDGIITAVPTGEYKDFRLEIPDGKFSIGSLRFQNTIVPLEEYKDRRTDLEKFKDFFREYGIDIETAKFRGSYSDETDGLKQYIMSGEKAISDIHEGSVWCFDDEGNFVLVEEGS